MVVVTNKAVPEDAMPKALEALDLYVEQDFLLDESLRGVIFVVNKKSLPGYYDGYVINDGRVYLTSGALDEFSNEKGRVRGKKSLERYDGTEVEIAPGDERRFTYRFSVEFEASPEGN